LIVANKHLKNRQEQLEHQQKALIQLNNELSATNTGLKVMAQNYQQIKEETNKEVARIINAKVLPIIERLGPDNRLSTQKTNLEVLYHLMTSITASLSGEANSFISLSATEMKVATMIKNGMTSRQIAKTMFVSMDTIKTHRRNIRRKLDIHDPHIDLKKVLETRSRRDSL
jgi:ATP/maltotriose-dependent transcriptional regulator MalT